MVLLSPGVEVSIIDETFFAAGGPGTVPLIFISTKSNKVIPNSNGEIAPGTLPENAGEVYLITGQRELVETFGEPFFEVVQGTPVQGSELNEYGLWAAFSYLGVANLVYIIRGDVDMSQLEPTDFEPRGAPLSGTYWLDTSETEFGVFSSNGASVPGLAWGAKNERVIDSRTEVDTVLLGDNGVLNPTDPLINSPGGDLIINGETVTINPNDSLDDVINAINAAGIDNITAQAFRYVEQSFICIKNTRGEAVIIDNTSDPGVLADLGLDAPGTTFLTPKTSIGVDGDIAVVTLTNSSNYSDNVVYEKLTPRRLDGTPDPAATTFWFAIGTDTWKAASPTVVEGASSPGPVVVGDQIILGDESNTITVTFTGTTLTDVVNDITTEISSTPVISRPNIQVSAPGGAYLLISNFAGTDIVVQDVSGNTGDPLTTLGIASRAGNRLFYTPHTTVPSNSVVGDIWIKTTEPNQGADWVIKLYNAQTNQFTVQEAPLFANDDAASTSLGIEAAAGTLYVQYNIYGTPSDPIASHLIKRYRGFSEVDVIGNAVNPTATAGEQFSINGSVVTIVQTDVQGVATAINSAAIMDIQASTENDRLVITNTSGFSVTVENVSGDPLGDLGITEGIYSNWELLPYEQGFQEPTTVAPEGTLWFNTNLRADIMVNDGDEWKGYRIQYPNTDPFGPIIAGSAPLTQTDGSPLVENDLWIDGSEMEDYPKIYRWSTTTNTWVLIDNTDQTTPFGIEFRDARFTADGQEDGSQDPRDMVLSNFVDPDAPDPRTYPAGMLLFNTRYSFGNVKEWLPNYFEEFVGVESETFPGSQYNVGFATFPLGTIDANNTGRWVTASGNRNDGAPWMLRKAQRQMVVRAMQAAVLNNEDVRAESLFFNLIAAPGYPELLEEMVELNTAKKEIAFIIGDTPARLRPNATDLNNWAKNANGAPSTGEEGLTIANTYVGLYYPWGLGTDPITGLDVVVPPSALALNVMYLNDQQAFQWFAPAGFARGVVRNASTVGYITDEGEYKVVELNQGQRDVLYDTNNINPIARIPNRGNVVYGQKTLHPVPTSALTRINVVRLVNYLRYNYNIIAQPFLFEPHDQQTWDAAKATFDNFNGGLVSLRGLNDFAVIVDSSNNTPPRIDRNELYIDVAIEPIRAIEFIFVPVRLVPTGSISG